MFEKHVSSPISFFVCILLAPLVIFQQNLAFKFIEVVFALLIMFFTKKHKKLLSIFVFFIVTTLSHILFSSSTGVTVVTILGFSVKNDSLNIGLQRGLSLATLFFYSKAFIRPDISFPGRLGRIISRAFGFLYYFLNEKIIISKNIFKNLDKILLKVSSVNLQQPDSKLQKKSSLAGLLLMFLLLAFHVIFLILEIMIF